MVFIVVYYLYKFWVEFDFVLCEFFVLCICNLYKGGIVINRGFDYNIDCGSFIKWIGVVL